MPYPYTTTVRGLNILIEQLRLVFPARLTPQTLRTWDIGRSNESSLLATLRFLGVVDEERNTLPLAKAVFTAKTDPKFAEGLAEMLKSSYGGLFEKYGEEAWTLSRDALVSFMREEDNTSTRVADQQAVTFQTLARHAGHGPAPIRAPYATRGRTAAAYRQADPDGRPVPTQGTNGAGSRAGVSLGDGKMAAAGGGFHIHINLPVTNDPGVYDMIFRSLRRHLVES